MSENLKVLVVGCGHMGASHARAYHNIDGFEVAGLVARGAERRSKLAAQGRPTRRVQQLRRGVSRSET